ncbi:hypothetical protein [Amycolatopsis minnesotensis]|uniref:Uncharacterized protein n=1 Tax=Amycolatopsis minnesotensis TaxID=337894 RepID=A0ABP5ECD3_9PSEU
MLFLERTRQLPTPQLPGQPELPDEATSPVFQLEAHIPSEAGDKLASIEFSTPYESRGPQFRAMVLAMASSVSFEPPAVAEDVSTKFEQVLG